METTLRFLVFGAFTLGCATNSSPRPGRSEKPSERHKVQVIYDADMAFDVGDARALSLLHALADRGEAEILAVMVSESVRTYDGLWGPPLADIINTHHGRPDIPVGVFKGEHADIGRYGAYAEKVVSGGHAHDLKDAYMAEDAVALYRRLLHAAPDHAVVIVSTGYLTNLAALLQSGPDDAAPFGGRWLIEKKVQKWVCMGGEYPSSAHAEELNLDHYPDATERVLREFPAPAVFVGQELGARYRSTGMATSETLGDNPVASAWQHHNGGQPRDLAAELAVLYAVRGVSYDGWEYFSTVTVGSNHYERTGLRRPGSKVERAFTTWMPAPDREHAYLQGKLAIKKMRAVVDGLVAEGVARAAAVDGPRDRVAHK